MGLAAQGDDAFELRQRFVITLGIEQTERALRVDKPLDHHARERRLAGGRRTDDQQPAAVSRNRDGLARRRSSEREVVTGQPPDERRGVGHDVFLDEFYDAGRALAARDVVRPLAQCRDRVGDGHRTFAQGQQRVIVLGVADAAQVVGRELERGQRRQEPRALGDAAGQQHQRALVEHQCALDAGLPDGGERGLSVRLIGGHDGAAEVEADAAEAQRLDQRGLGWIAERSHFTPSRQVQQATILGDDGVEHPVQVGAGIAKIGQHAPGHEQKSPARFSDARQRGRRRRTDLAVLSDGAVVIDGERVDDHTVKSLPSRYHRAASGTRI